MADLTKRMISFGCDEVHIAKLLEDSTTARTYDTTQGLVWLEGISELTITEVSEEYQLDGDNGVVDIRSIVSGYDVTFTYGALTYEQLKLIKSGTLVETGTPVTKREYKIKSTDAPDYFGLIAVINSSGEKIVLPKVKAISVEIPHSNLTHAAVTVTAKAIKSNLDKVMQKRIQEDPADMTAPSITDFA